MIGALAFVYGLACYGLFFVTFLYAVGFLAGVGVPKSIDSGAAGALLPGLGVDVLLLGLFAVQHTGMARRAFKRWWTRRVAPAVERSTYVLVTSLVLLLLFWQWRPLPGTIWEVHDAAGRDLLWAVFAAGWATVLFGTFMIDHAHLFGVRQVWARLHGRQVPEPRFQTRWLYRFIRHPLMVGFMIAFWATPTMSAGHLLFAAAATGYIVIATLGFEERDLAHYLGEPYRRYRSTVPAFIPWLGKSVAAQGSQDAPGGEAAD